MTDFLWKTRTRFYAGRAMSKARVTDSFAELLERITGSNKSEARDAHNALAWLRKEGVSPKISAAFYLGYSSVLVQYMVVSGHPQASRLAAERISLNKACLTALHNTKVRFIPEVSHIRDSLVSLDKNQLPDFLARTKFLVRTYEL